jgi:hypothetical protein
VTLGKLYIGNDFFVEYFLSTFTEYCKVLDKEKSSSRRQVMVTEPVPSAHRVTLGKGSLFTRSTVLTISKEAPVGPFTRFFVEHIRWYSAKENETS